MPIRTAAALGIAASLAVQPLAADERSFFDEAERFLRRIGTQYAVLMLRTVIDITYENLSVDPRSNDVTLSGVSIWPELDWDGEGACRIDIERLASGDLNSLSRFRSVMQVSGVAIPSACFQPQQAAMLSSFGFDGLVIDTMAIDLGYDMPSSGAELAITASIRDAGDLAIAADLDYFFLRIDPASRLPESDASHQEPRPVARLDSLEIAFENRGLFQTVEPLLAQQLGGDITALPALAQGALVDGLSEGGTRQLSAAESAFVENVVAELARFVHDKDRLILTADPEESVLIDAETMASPAAIIALLEPEVAAVSKARREMLAPALVGAAGSDPESLSPDERRRLGSAFLSGLGAPRSIELGTALLAPAAEGGDAGAAAALADAMAAARRWEEAYRYALIAMAGGVPTGIGIADRAEGELPLATVLALQGEVAGDAGANPQALVAEGGVAALRARAQALAAGSGDAPRSYAAAYRLAALAAAAGDRLAAALMTRLDESFTALPEPDRSAWAETAAAASARAVETWTGGLGAALAPAE